MNVNDLKNLIEANIDGTSAIINSNDNVHFEAIIVSESFNEIKSKVKQQQIVYKVLGNLISSGEIHAFSLKTFTPEQWKLMKMNS